MTKKEALDILIHLKSCAAYKEEEEAIQIAIEELKQNPYNHADLLVEEIKGVTWYSMTSNGMEIGAPSRKEAWYKAADILEITDRYLDTCAIQITPTNIFEEFGAKGE